MNQEVDARDNMTHTESSNLRDVMWNMFITRMRANAQRDGRPAEYRWRPLFNAAKFG